MSERPLGCYIRERRLARGYTQQQLDELAKHTAGAIQRIEDGAYSPGYAGLHNLCCALGISFSILLNLDPRRASVWSAVWTLVGCAA